MLEQAYHVVAEDFCRLLGQIWLQKINDELWKFTQPLDQLLHRLFQHPTPAWREQLDAFLEEQAAAGFTVMPESLAELVAFLEAWASELSEPAPLKSTGQRIVRLMAYHPAEKSRVGRQVPRSQTYQQPPKPPQYGPIVRTDWHVFHDKLKEAAGYLDDIQRLLEPLGRKVIAAKPDEPVEVETDVDEIAALIYRHNEAMEKARQAWLDGKLGGDTHTDLVNALSPSSLGLPGFTDAAQAERAQAQWKEIGKRLNQKVAFFDKLIFAMEVTEKVGDVASLALGAGLVVSAVKQGGKIALVKAAKIATQAAVAEGVARATDAAGQAIEDALLAAGASQETISAIQTAADVVNLVLDLKRTGAALSRRAPNLRQPSNAPAGTTGALGNSNTGQPSTSIAAGLAATVGGSGNPRKRPAKPRKPSPKTPPKKNPKPKIPVVGKKKRKRRRRHSKLRGRMGTPPAHLKMPQAHHELPQQFAKEFSAAGLDIDDPKYGRWVEAAPPDGHQSWSRRYSALWRDFFLKNPKPNRAQILQFLSRVRTIQDFK